jgi:hypothetical protein
MASSLLRIERDGQKERKTYGAQACSAPRKDGGNEIVMGAPKYQLARVS